MDNTRTVPPEPCLILDPTHTKMNIAIQETDKRMEEVGFFKTGNKDMVVLTITGRPPSKNEVLVTGGFMTIGMQHRNIQWKTGYLMNELTREVTGVLTTTGATVEELLRNQADPWSSSLRDSAVPLRSHDFGKEWVVPDHGESVQEKMFEERSKWIRHLAEAVAFLHKKQIAHRDINPKCCLIDGERNLKLGDFGSPAEAGYLNHPFYRVGSGVYCPLELLKYNTSSLKGDIYSFLLTAMFIATNIHPFSADKWKTMFFDEVCEEIETINTKWMANMMDRNRLLALCLSDMPNDRPNIESLLSFIKEEENIAALLQEPNIVEQFKLMSKSEEGLLPVSGVEPQFTDFHLAEEKEAWMATERPFADIEKEITANYGRPQYINANYPPALKKLLRKLYRSCVTANDFQRFYTVAHNIDVTNERDRSIIVTEALEPISKDLKARRLSALYKYEIIWNNDNIDAVTADDWQTLSRLCRDSFKFAMAQRGSRTAIRRTDNVVSKFYNICRLFALKFGENENVIWDRLEIDRAAGSYHAILTSEPDIYMARFSLEQLVKIEKFTPRTPKFTPRTPPIIEARNSWLNIATRAGCRDLATFFNQTNDAVRISNELAQVAEDYLRRQGYLNGQGNNLAQALQALNVVDDDEEEADDEEEEENEENADSEGEEEENEENTDREGEDEENLEVEEEKPGTSAGTSGQINASPKLEAQTAPKEEKPDI